MSKESIMFYIESFAIIIIVVALVFSTTKASHQNGRLEMCNELGMVYTSNMECVTPQEYTNLNNIKPVTNVGLGDFDITKLK